MALFCVTPVTLAPIIALISVFPAAVPELVTVPVLFNEAPEMVTPFAVAPLFWSVRLKAPVIPPVILRTPVPAFWIVEAPANVIALLMVFAELAVERAKMPEPAVALPRVSEPPDKVSAMLSSKLRLCANLVADSVIVPVV